MRINREIRAMRVRLILQDGSQAGVVTIDEAHKAARDANLDLVEIAPHATPPVCKIVDYGKLRYEQAKKEKESRRAQHQVKVKEVKFRPNIDDHDFQFKLKNARQFLEKGNKVRVTCMFRGREVVHSDVGQRVIDKMAEELSDIATVESGGRMGRMLHVVLAPSKKKTEGNKKHAQN